MTRFQLIGLPHTPFEPLFLLADRQLAEIGARRVIAGAHSGYPCRISLADAQLGDELLLLPFEHQPANSPYRASGPIYVRRGVQQQTLAPDEITDYVATRLISVRAYDAQHMMVAAEVCEGTDAGDLISQHFDHAGVAYIHLHNARQGCFSCLARRA